MFGEATNKNTTQNPIVHIVLMYFLYFRYCLVATWNNYVYCYLQVGTFFSDIGHTIFYV